VGAVCLDPLPPGLFQTVDTLSKRIHFLLLAFFDGCSKLDCDLFFPGVRAVPRLFHVQSISKFFFCELCGKWSPIVCARGLLIVGLSHLFFFIRRVHGLVFPEFRRRPPVFAMSIFFPLSFNLRRVDVGYQFFQIRHQSWMRFFLYTGVLHPSLLLGLEVSDTIATCSPLTVLC